MSQPFLKVGELAARTGITVRTLHHYDEIGLLRPSRRSASGHRLYSEGDVARLLRIRGLVQVGFSLDSVRAALDGEGFSPVEVLDMQVEQLREDLARTERLCRRLEGLRDRLRAKEDVSVGEFLEVIEEMTMFEKYYTPEQLEQLARRREELGEDAIRAAEAEWPRLIAAVKAEMAKGTEPGDPAVQALARRWKELVEMFTGGDPGIARSLGNLYAGEAGVREEKGLEGGVMEYVGKALGKA